MNTNLTPDERADLVIKELTLDEKIALLHGVGMPTDEPVNLEKLLQIGGVGYMVGVPRLGIPGIDMGDAAYGVRSSGVNGRYAPPYPPRWPQPPAGTPMRLTNTASSWPRTSAPRATNMTLAAASTSPAGPANGRTFEYLGEDPILAGELVPASFKAPVRTHHRRHQALAFNDHGERPRLRQHLHRQAPRP